jgi:hypothetical protein
VTEFSEVQHASEGAVPNRFSLCFVVPLRLCGLSGDSTGSSYVLYAVATALTQISLSLVFIGIVLREY